MSSTACMGSWNTAAPCGVATTLPMSRSVPPKGGRISTTRTCQVRVLPAYSHSHRTVIFSLHVRRSSSVLPFYSSKVCSLSVLCNVAAASDLIQYMVSRQCVSMHGFISFQIKDGSQLQPDHCFRSLTLIARVCVSGARDVGSSSQSQWVYISDTTVQTVPESRVLNSQAYLLFYEELL